MRTRTAQQQDRAQIVAAQFIAQSDTERLADSRDKSRRYALLRFRSRAAEWVSNNTADKYLPNSQAIIN